MRVTFIRPSIGGRRAADAMEPLAFAILRALTPPHIEVRLHDERVENIPFDEPTDLVAMTVETYTALRASEIAARYRDRGVPVVAGGYHPTLLPDESLKHFDSVAIGDAEPIWPSMLRDAERGCLQRTYHAPSDTTLSNVTFDRSIFRGKKYAPVTCVQFGRGCRFSCEFCSIHAFYGKSVRARPARDVAIEIEAAGRSHVLIVDDNLFVDVSRLNELLAVIEPLNVRWACQISLDVARQPGLIARMARAGCIAALVGFESLNEQNLTIMGKRWNARLGGYDAALRAFASEGIMIYGSFVFGYDHDTLDTFESTAQWAIESGMVLVNFSVLTPTPGTPLLTRLRQEGRIIRDHWWMDHHYRYGQSVFQPRWMTPDQLTEGTLKARRMFYGASSIAKRFLSPPNFNSISHAAAFLAGNAISRTELRRKLGQGLGKDGPTLNSPAPPPLRPAPADALATVPEASCA